MPESKYADETEVKVAQLMTPEWANFAGTVHGGHVLRLVCRTREDKARFIQAKLRREMGLRYREERDAFLQRYVDMDDAALDALIADQG